MLNASKVLGLVVVSMGVAHADCPQLQQQDPTKIAVQLAGAATAAAEKLSPPVKMKKEGQYCSIKWPADMKFEESAEYTTIVSDTVTQKETSTDEKGVAFTNSTTKVTLKKKGGDKEIEASIRCTSTGLEAVSIEEQRQAFTGPIKIEKVGVVETKDHKTKSKIFSPVFLLSTGGYTGMFTTGVGTFITPFVLVKGTIGYTPASQIGNRNGLVQYTGTVEIHPFAKLNIKIPVKNDYKIYIDPFYASYAWTYSPDKDLFYNLPSQYPKGYYHGTADRALISFGSSIGLMKGKSPIAQVDVGMHYLQREEVSPLAVETRDVRLSDLPKIGSLGFGLTVFLDRK